MIHFVINFIFLIQCSKIDTSLIVNYFLVVFSFQMDLLSSSGHARGLDIELLDFLLFILFLKLLFGSGLICNQVIIEEQVTKTIFLLTWTSTCKRSDLSFNFILPSFFSWISIFCCSFFQRFLKSSQNKYQESKKSEGFVSSIFPFLGVNL